MSEELQDAQSDRDTLLLGVIEMTKRELLLAKMCEAFQSNITLYSPQYSMEKALELAERFFNTAELPQPNQEEISYAHRAMIMQNSAAQQTALNIIHTWLRFDTSLALRKTITSADCEKLALRLSLAMKE